MDPWMVTAIGGGMLAVAAAVGYVLLTRQTLRERTWTARQQLAEGIETWFAVEPCFRCYEYEMRLLQVSPNGRSVHYQCTHCKRRVRSPAGTPQAPRVVGLHKEFELLLERYRKRGGDVDELETVLFEAPEALLPYQQTSRTPIPEAVRCEVWRRDGGQCVRCQAKHQLQFDHIIPISRGGASSVANVQLLCLPCNLAKGDTV